MVFKLQFGMDMEDAFGTVLLIETLFVAVSEAVFVEAIYMVIARTATEVHGDPWWLWPLLVAITVKAILFVALVWIGFISLGRSTFLKLWVIVGLIIDLGVSALLLICHMAVKGGHGPLWIMIVAMAYWILFLSLRFYIYLVSWNAWKDICHTNGLRGYGQGIGQLFFTYKNEFQRITIILLTAEIIWNSWTALAFDLPLEISFGIAIGGSFLYRPMVVFRLARIFFASLILYFVKWRKTIWLKYSWLPFLLLSIGLGIFTPIFVYLTVENPQQYAIIETAYFTEILTSVGINIILFYSIIGLVVLKPCTPVPFVHAPE